MFIHMIIQQTKLLLGHMRNGDETGKLLTTDLEYTQIYSGIDTPILHRTTPPHFLQWREPSWMTNYKRILLDTNGEITINQQWLPSPQRKHDRFLMPTFYKFIPDKQSLIHLNNCRLYLQIFSISDLVSADGTKLLKHPLNGTRLLHCHSSLTWPHQKRPQKETWKFFSQVVRKIFCKPNTYTLKKPLGKWKPTTSKQTIWTHYFDKDNKKTIQIHTKSMQSMDLPPASRCKSIHLQHQPRTAMSTTIKSPTHSFRF